ncbi:putative DNA mismatch repair protein Mlh1 C terminus [Trypanosoma vivax]|nr:putative DNA mismatch repair protein Mlh1 C terminus [Trypanosoma vivax]
MFLPLALRIVPDVPVSVTEDTGAICEASNCSSSSAPLFSVPITQLGVADEDADPDEDVAYVMQQFKRVRVEIQEAIGVSAMPEAVSNETRGNSTTAEPEAEGIKPVRLASSEGGLVVAEKVQSNLVLTSVATIISHIHADTSPTAKALFKDFVFVGVLNAHFFLAQSGTTLYVVDTLRLVRIVAYQRIFLSWASASTVALPRLELQNPVLVTDLLLFALKHDVGDMAADPPGEMERSATVMRMDRLLRRWRLMLQDYFAIEISADGFLIALPLTLNACWPPSPASSRCLFGVLQPKYRTMRENLPVSLR